MIECRRGKRTKKRQFTSRESKVTYTRIAQIRWNLYHLEMSFKCWSQ